MMMGGSGQGPQQQQQVPTMPWKDPRAWTVRDYEKLSEVLEEWASRENGKLNLLNNNTNYSGGRGGAGGGFPNWPGMQGPQQGGGGGGGYWDGGGGGGEYGGRHSGSGSGSSGRRSRRSVQSSPSFIPSGFLFSCLFVLIYYISVLFDPESHLIGVCNQKKDE